MRITTKIIKPLIPVLVLLLSWGCVEYREDLVLEKDLSGHLSYEFGFPDLGSLDEDDDLYVDEFDIIDRADSIEGLEITEQARYDEGNTTWARVEISFYHIHRLNELDAQWLGYFQISRNDDGDLVFLRYVTLSDSIDTGGDDKVSQALKNAMLGQYEWSYTLHLPTELISGNSLSYRTDTRNNTVTWVSSLSAMLDEAITMEAVFRESNFFRKTFKSKIHNL